MSSSSFMRRVGSLAASAIIFPGIANAAGTYTLQKSFEGKNILNHFDFFDQPDPTNGFVTYVNQSYAEDAGLVKITESGSLYMGVDYDTVLTADGPGRESIRIESNEYYDKGLYVVDIKHMPGSICGTWPAFWTVGPDWPTDGEIDIIEGVNKHEANKIVLHTSGSCDVGGEHDMSGDMTSSECGDASGTIGCVVEGQQGSSGDPFNKNGGGVYAMEWQKEYLKIWYFPRSSIPTSLTEGKPDTSAFGTPMAHLQGSCNFEERFTHQKMILDTTFCGDWAGGVFGDSGCPVSDPSNPIQSCVNYVAENPTAFKEAYWELNSIKIYQLGGTSEMQGTQDAATSTQTATEAAETTAATRTNTATATAEATTSAASHTSTEAVSTETASTETASAPHLTNGVESAPTTTAAPGTASAVDSASSETTSKSTRFVTVTTTLCPVETLQTANAVPPAESSSKPAGEIAEIPASNPTTTPAPAPTPEPETTTATQPAVTTETSVDAVAPPATVGTPAAEETHAPMETPAPVETTAAVNTPQPEASSIPPDSVIYTAPDESSSAPGWTIVSTSSQFVSVPSATPSSWEPTDTTPSGVDSTSSPTTPSSPVFTGMGSKLSISASAIVGALAMLILV
ncbi:putative GPI anchored endo-1,3(4)-beta-glucanase [Aspergillus undulatus]|uniref:putative GPI anchored endo-1,3(4)-beta-glucanase n=1 Tax=Aspergillus undulatus TaxID=1810928 RepID=UPI003CCCE058